MSKEEISRPSKKSHNKIQINPVSSRLSSSRTTLVSAVCLLLIVATDCQAPDCLVLPNTDKTTIFDGTQCLCAVNNSTLMHWDLISSVGCLINCSAVANSDKGPDSVSCNCNPGFTWNATTFLCEADCMNDANSVPGPLAADGTCICRTKFTFDTSIARCRINCTNLQNIAQQQDLTILDSCTCRSLAYTFNFANVSCDLNCSMVRFAFGPANANNTCTCNNSFSYNVNTTRC